MEHRNEIQQITRLGLFAQFLHKRLRQDITEMREDTLLERGFVGKHARVQALLGDQVARYHDKERGAISEPSNIFSQIRPKSSSLKNLLG